MALDTTSVAATQLAHRRRLNDAELLSTEFRFTDPENSIAGLNRGVPDPDAHPVIIGYYDEKPSGGRRANPDHPFIWCCHCGKRTHWDGRVVRDDRGETYIIGARVCGRDHYGDRYGEAERIFKGERERRRTLRRWQSAYPLITSIKSDVEAALNWPGLTQLELKRDEIRNASSAGYQKLIRFCSTGVEMFAHHEVRDHGAEADRDRRYALAVATYKQLPPDIRRARRDAGEDPQLDNTPIWKRTSEPLGHVLGGDFLRSDCDPRAWAIKLAETVREIVAIGETGTDGMDTSQLSALLRRLSDGSIELQSALHRLSFTHLFFSQDNLDRLARWSAQEARFGYADGDGALIIRDASRGHSLIDPIGDVTPPATGAIDMMRHLNEEFTLP